jgi:hypothetical protein
VALAVLRALASGMVAVARIVFASEVSALRAWRFVVVAELRVVLLAVVHEAGPVVRLLEKVDTAFVTFDDLLAQRADLQLNRFHIGLLVYVLTVIILRLQRLVMKRI